MAYNDDKMWEESSVHSDISANTDIKVFRGGIRNGQVVNNKTSSDSSNNNNNNELVLKEYSPNKGKNKMNNNNNNSQNQVTKKHKKSNNTFNYNINVKTLHNKDSNNKTSLITTSHHLEGDILSFRSDADISVKQNIKNENNNINNNCKITYDNKDKLLSKFKDFTQEDEEIINGYYVDKKESKHSKCMFKSFKHVKIRFKIASIEKGVALLISEDDCIFILPTILLPKTAKIGNTYLLKIEETNLNSIFKNQITAIQKTYMNNQSVQWIIVINIVIKEV